MSAPMPDEWLQTMATFYGITMDEARERHAICVAQGDDPEDPICVGCARRPTEILGYITALQESEHDPPSTPELLRLYVIHEEGTYNRANGHFLCDECYLRNGMPSSERGWVCP